MSPEKQNIELVKLLGWTAPPEYKSFNTVYPQDNLQQVPDFFNDSKALSKVKQILLELELNGNLPNAVSIYTDHLCSIVGSVLKYTHILATPANEIEALLKTTNKWHYDSP